MPQKQACQPQNYDKTFMENMLAKMFTYKDKIFLNKGPGYLCLWKNGFTSPMCLVTLVFFGLHYHDIKPFFRALSYQANA